MTAKSPTPYPAPNTPEYAELLERARKDLLVISIRRPTAADKLRLAHIINELRGLLDTNPYSGMMHVAAALGFLDARAVAMDHTAAAMIESAAEMLTAELAKQ